MTYPIHPAAAALPEMGEQEFKELVADVEANGLLVDIELLGDQVIDGRHRQAACEKAGVKPRYVTVDIGEFTPGEYVWRLNGLRRHLTPSQRAAIAAEMLPQFEDPAVTPKGRPKKGAKNCPLSGRASEKAANVVGVNKQYVKDAKRVKQESPETFEQVKRGEVTLSQAKAHVSNNSGEIEWYTPLGYIDAAVDVLGAIDLDPASSKVAQQFVKAKKYFTKDDDGLSKKWRGKVWLNPPYRTDLISKFAEKLVKHVAACDVPEAIVLCNNGTETGWGQQLLEEASAVCFPKGRIKFLNRDGKPANTPLQGQMFLYFGENPERFREVFSELGTCLFGGEY